MSSLQRQARVAGLLYLLMSAAAVFTYTTLPTWTLVGGDATAMANKIAAAGLSYRFGLVTELAGEVLFVCLVLALHRLFEGVDKRQSAWMVALVLVQVPMSFANLLLGMAPLVLSSGAAYWSAFDPRQLDALAQGCLDLRGYGIRATMTFWGLWLLPFGLLVIRSGFVPRILGVLLVVGCAGYVAVSALSLLFPERADFLQRFLGLALGEILITLWFLIKGVRTEPAPAH